MVEGQEAMEGRGSFEYDLDKLILTQTYWSIKL